MITEQALIIILVLFSQLVPNARAENECRALLGFQKFANLTVTEDELKTIFTDGLLAEKSYWKRFYFSESIYAAKRFSFRSRNRPEDEIIFSVIVEADPKLCVGVFKKDENYSFFITQGDVPSHCITKVYVLSNQGFIRKWTFKETRLITDSDNRL